MIKGNHDVFKRNDKDDYIYYDENDKNYKTVDYMYDHVKEFGNIYLFKNSGYVEMRDIIIIHLSVVAE